MVERSEKYPLIARNIPAIRGYCYGKNSSVYSTDCANLNEKYQNRTSRSEEIQRIAQIDLLPDREMVFGFCHVVEEKFQKQGTAQSPPLNFEVGKSHRQVSAPNVINADKRRILHSLGKPIAALGVRGGAAVFRAGFSQIFPTDCLIAGFFAPGSPPSSTRCREIPAFPSAVPATSVTVQRLCSGGSPAPHIETPPLRFVPALVKLRQHLGGGGDEIEAGGTAAAAPSAADPSGRSRRFPLTVQTGGKVHCILRLRDVPLSAGNC